MFELMWYNVAAILGIALIVLGTPLLYHYETNLRGFLGFALCATGVIMLVNLGLIFAFYYRILLGG